MSEVSLSDLLSQLSIALDAVEADLAGAARYHSKRVAVLSLAIGEEMGFHREQLFNLAGCALLHDNALTEYILSERPSDAQSINIRSHCVLGEANAKFVPFPGKIDGFILYHHECADGSGAFRKKEGEYPVEAGIIALADQIDVKFHLQKNQAAHLMKIKESIKNQTGKRYGKDIAAAAIKVLDEALMEQMEDGRVSASLKERMPEIKGMLTNEEIVNLSGIIAKVIDYKSAFTKDHSIQIANKAWFMGSVYHYPEDIRARVYLAAALHDIGKLFIPTAILEKPGKLTDEEFQVIKSHAGFTWEVLSSIKGFEEICKWASYHHEKLDGTGYPFGKQGAQLDFNSRLLACLDIYQAVREKRPYHPVRSHEDTMKILYEMAGNGVIDKGICQDLDRELAALKDGIAAMPCIVCA